MELVLSVRTQKHLSGSKSCAHERHSAQACAAHAHSLNSTSTSDDDELSSSSSLLLSSSSSCELLLLCEVLLLSSSSLLLLSSSSLLTDEVNELNDELLLLLLVESVWLNVESLLLSKQRLVFLHESLKSASGTPVALK